MDKNIDKLFAAEMEQAQKKSITEVQLDALVVLKIVNHCMEKLPTVPVSGSLLGLNVDNTLQVTDCYAVPSTSDFENDSDDEAAESDEESVAGRERQHQIDMLRFMRDSNSDNNAVGWYQSTIMEQYNVAQTVDNQYKHQLELGQRCVCLVFDPVRSHHGHLELRALRLTEQFMDAVRKLYLDAMEQKLTATIAAAETTVGARQQTIEEERRKLEDLRELQKVIPTAVMPQSIEDITITQELLMTSRFRKMQIFEEVPIKINNSALVDAYMHDLTRANFIDNDISFDCLDLASGPYLESELGGLVESSDDLLNDLKELANYQRRAARARGRPEEQPSRLNGIMIGKQMDNYVEQLNSYAAQSINKIYLAKSTMRQSD